MTSRTFASFPQDLWNVAKQRQDTPSRRPQPTTPQLLAWFKGYNEDKPEAFHAADPARKLDPTSFG
jgi:hypothetical protein